jgi:hypothetical protein
MKVSRCYWDHANQDDRTAFWLMSAGVVIGAYLAIAF